MPNSLKGSMRAFALLAVGYAAMTLISSMQASPNSCLYIDSSGGRIPNVFWGLRPDVHFGKALERELVSLRHEKVPHFQNLVYNGACPKKLLRKAAFLQGDGSCYGQYMIAHQRTCGNCVGGTYYWFDSTGSYECLGYDIIGDGCSGCVIEEGRCNPCFPGQ